jgi:Ni,Fe-hydrogenase maturation factor
VDDLDVPDEELSMHGIGVNHLLAALPAAFAGRTSPEIVVIGAEVGEISPFAEEVTPPLEVALDRAVDLIRRECAE